MKSVKEISIKSFLEARGVRPTTDKGYYGLYRSPIREDANPSFRVDFRLNLWYDYGLGAGGSIIDLVMKLEQCDFGTAVKLLEGDSSLIRIPEIDYTKSEVSELAMTDIRMPEHPALARYMKSRGIRMELVGRHCEEIHYKVGGKKYFAIGFFNDADGFELRNAHFKGSISPKGITTYTTGSDSVLVFEGFMDFLSYLSLEQLIDPACDVVILNSVANLKKALPFLQMHGIIYTYLDNDEAGKRATEEISRLLPDTLRIDCSGRYADYKDLNEYLVAKPKR